MLGAELHFFQFQHPALVFPAVELGLVIVFYPLVQLLLEEGDVPDDKVRDRDYEQTNTYSNLASVGHPWLNLLLLNFSYHNAHHERPIVPWHELPALHGKLFPGEHVQTIPMIELLKGYHRDRVSRILSDDYGEVKATGTHRADGFLGAAGVSFLTAV